MVISKKNNLVIYLVSVFSLTWGFDWIIILFFGLENYNSLGMTPWGMLTPAFAAIFFSVFVDKQSDIYYKTHKDKTEWIFLSFMILTILYAVNIILALSIPELKTVFQGSGSLLMTLWTLNIFFIFGKTGKKQFEAAGLSLENLDKGFKYISFVLLFFLLQVIMEFTAGTGAFAGISDKIYGIPLPPVLYYPALALFFIPVVVIGIPLSGLAAVFGEEYGWRGYLQSRLIKHGKLRGVVLTGFIWGLWHIPVILRGIHTYKPDAPGIILAISFFILWGIIQGYVFLKTGNIWIVAFLHGVVNSVYAFMRGYIVKADDPVFSFGIGLYGLICMVPLVWLLLKDKIWKHC